jgi:hypothetical protein
VIVAPKDLLQWLDRPSRHEWPTEEELQRLEHFFKRRLGVKPSFMRYAPYMCLLLHIYCDDKVVPLNDFGEAKFDVCLCVSDRAPVVTWRTRRLDEKPWWDSDRRWTFDRTTRVFDFAHRNAQALCDEFDLQLMLPDPLMDKPLPGRFQKLNPKGPATLFTEMFSEM